MSANKCPSGPYKGPYRVPIGSYRAPRDPPHTGKRGTTTQKRGNLPVKLPLSFYPTTTGGMLGVDKSENLWYNAHNNGG